MGVNKVVYSGTVLIDLSADTVDKNSLLKGLTAHAKNGDVITGELTVQKYYTGSTTPSSTLGSDGDIYLKI